MANEENIPAPVPGVYENLATNKRVLWLREGVDDNNMAELSAQLYRLSDEDPESDIILFINSPGGSITAGLVLHDMMNLIPNDVVTVGIGMCASMGQFLLTVGAPGKRFITPNSRVLLHQPLGGYGGSATDIMIEADLIEDMKHQLAGITASRTGKTKEQVIEDGDRDHWFRAEEALEYGFVDHIVTSLDEIHAILKKGNK